MKPTTQNKPKKNIGYFFRNLFSKIKFKLNQYWQRYRQAGLYGIKAELEETAQRRRQMWFLPRSYILEELNNRSLILAASGVITGLLLLFIIWASFFKLQELAIAFGEIVPAGQVQFVQHLEGGIVHEILVKDGDIVNKGQALVRLDDTIFSAELQQIEARQFSLGVDVDRLRAYLDEQHLEINQELIDSLHDPNNPDVITSLIADDELLLQLQKEERTNQSAVLEAQIAQREETLIELKQEYEIEQRNLALLTNELAMYEQLAQDGIVSRLEYSQKQRERNNAERNMIRLRGSIEGADDALREAQSRLQEMTATLSREAIDNIGDLVAELLEISYAKQQLEDQVKRTMITAPITGIITDLEIGVGSIIPPGNAILQIVPMNEILEAEVEISTLDVGQIQLGDRVRVKVMTFDFSRYGAIEGTLAAISPTTFMTEDGVPYYKGRVTLSQQYVGIEKNKLVPGMTVQADIVTGDKTVMTYLLKPIQRSFDTALTER